jgi:soluble lytic murein transglycosylase-like protein
MRVSVWRMAVGAVLTLAAPVWADIYLSRDKFGVVHITNAPSAPARLVMKEFPRRQLPPPRVLPVGGTTLSRRQARSTPSMSLIRPARAGGPTDFDPLIREKADRYNLEYALVKAVIRAESGFNPLAISPKGALGLMQLMPKTAAMHRVRNAFLPHDNIDGGCQHLRMLLDRYGGNLTLSLAAYNAGIQRVENAGGVPPIAETREYVQRVLSYRLAYLRETPGVVTARR